MAVGMSQLGDLGPQLGDQRLEQLRIETGMGVGDRRATGAIDVETLPRARGDTGILEATQTAERGVERARQQKGQVVVRGATRGWDVGTAAVTALSLCETCGGTWPQPYGPSSTSVRLKEPNYPAAAEASTEETKRERKAQVETLLVKPSRTVLCCQSHFCVERKRS